MAKFCTKCGTKLEEGLCPNCDEIKKEEEVVVEETTTEPVKEENTVEIKKEVKEEPKKETPPSIQAEDIKKAGSDCFKAVVNIFTKPFDAIKEFVSDSKLIAGIIMILLAVASSGLYRIATIKSMTSSTGSNNFNVNDFMSILYGGKVSQDPNYLKEFFTEAGTQLAIIGFMALFGYLIITKLFKGKATIKQMITAVAISFSVVLLGNLVNSILVFIDAEVIGYIRTYITSFASIFSILILYYGVKGVAEIDKNKLFVAVASMSVIATACWDIIDKIFE